MPGPIIKDVDSSVELFQNQVSLLKDFFLVYIAKDNFIKNYAKNYSATNPSEIIQKDIELIALLDKLLSLENMESLLIKNILSDENTSVEVSDPNIIKNLNAIKSMFLTLRDSISEEIKLLSEPVVDQSKMRVIIKEELEFFYNIKTYYINIIRRVRSNLQQMLNHRPLISVVIPAYNEEKYIGRLLDSLSKQTYPNKEFIVVDNRSTDNTKGKLAPHTYNYIYLEEQGVANARNKGAAISKGNIIVFLDADCVVYKDLLEGIYLAFQEGYNCGKVIDMYADRSGWKQKLLHYWWYIPAKIDQWTGIPLTGAGACTFCDRELFMKIGGYNKDMKMMEDADLIKRLRRSGKFKFFEESYILTSMRRFAKKGYLLSNLVDMLAMIDPKKADREWVR